MGNASGPPKSETLRGERQQRQIYPDKMETGHTGSPIAWRALLPGAPANRPASSFLFPDQNNRLSSSRDGFLCAAVMTSTNPCGLPRFFRQAVWVDEQNLVTARHLRQAIEQIMIRRNLQRTRPSESH